MKPNIVFCITCKGRKPHIMQTLPKNLTDCWHSKFVLLDYNSQDGLAEYVREHHQADLDSGRLVLYSFHEPDKFHMAHAKNMAHRCGILEGGDVLVNLDADNFTGANFDLWLKDQFANCGEYFLWSRMIKSGPTRLNRGITGRIAVTRNAFLMVGGYDEKFNTWSPDDKDFNCRLRMIPVPCGEIEHRFLGAILHNDKMRFRDYPHVEKGCYDDPPKPVCPLTPIANAGKVGCGTVYRNGSSEAIQIMPIPTRIFGIGLHKTGTTSLDTAFNVLGFNAVHWNTAPWAKAVYQEMTIDGRSPTLEQHYAFSDLPFPLLYKELDASYPGSKFILTIRSERDWLQSVKNHWDPDINPNRKYWDMGFSHRLHQLLYGQRSFDAAVFLARYRKHNSEVQEYFRGRPGDLLVLKVENGINWDAICSFLDRPVPAIPYPHELRTRLLLTYEI